VRNVTERRVGTHPLEDTAGSAVQDGGLIPEEKQKRKKTLKSCLKKGVGDLNPAIKNQK
jgi:hypothetical protein